MTFTKGDAQQIAQHLLAHEDLLARMALVYADGDNLGKLTLLSEAAQLPEIQPFFKTDEILDSYACILAGFVLAIEVMNEKDA